MLIGLTIGPGVNKPLPKCIPRGANTPCCTVRKADDRNFTYRDYVVRVNESETVCAREGSGRRWAFAQL